MIFTKSIVLSSTYVELVEALCRESSILYLKLDGKAINSARFAHELLLPDASLSIEAELK